MKPTPLKAIPRNRGKTQRPNLLPMGKSTSGTTAKNTRRGVLYDLGDTERLTG
jgi:hypothetical protein